MGRTRRAHGGTRAAKPRAFTIRCSSGPIRSSFARTAFPSSIDTTPRRIRVHAFLCVVGLLFYRWVQRRVEAVTKARIPTEALTGRLDRIQVVAMARPGSRKVKVVLQKLDREQTAIVKALGLARFVLN